MESTTSSPPRKRSNSFSNIDESVARLQQRVGPSVKVRKRSMGDLSLGITDDSSRQRIETLSKMLNLTEGKYGGLSRSPLSKMRYNERRQRAFSLSPNRFSPAYQKALAQSKADYESTRKKHGENSGFTTGYGHEVIETTRLAEAQTPITGSQVSIRAPIDEMFIHPRPAYNEKPGQLRTFRPDFSTPSGFMDIKTGVSLDSSREQLYAMAMQGNVDIATATSSINLDMPTLSDVDKVARLHGNRMRVRSNSMKEGEFVSLADIEERRKVRTAAPEMFTAFPT